METYEIFSGEDLKIADKIKQRRYQMLVHSYIYYELDTNIISDHQWSEWAVELAKLQNKYPDISKKVIYADMFDDWDGSSGAFINYKLPNIVTTATWLLQENGMLSKPTEVRQDIPKKKPATTKKRLF